MPSCYVVTRLVVGALLVTVSSCGLDESGRASASGGADGGALGGSGGTVGGAGGASGGVGGATGGGGGAAGASGASAGAGGATGGSAGAGGGAGAGGATGGSAGVGGGAGAGGATGGSAGVGGSAGAGGATGGSAGAGGVAGGGTGGTGGTVSQPPCHPAGLVDTFDGSAVSGLWTQQGAAQNISVSGGQLHITPNPADAKWAGLVSATYDFDECAVWVRVPEVYSNATTGFTYFQLVGASTIAFEARNGNLEMKLAGNQSAVPYDSQAHKWWRLREAGSTVYFETSPDGVNWTERHSVPSPADITAMKVGLGLVPGTAPSGPLETQFDDLDATP